MSKPGALGELLDDSDQIIRLGDKTIQSDYTRVSEKQFVLSSKEKVQEWKRISVYETSLTTVKQALQMTSDKRAFVIQLKVDGIRSIEFNGDSPFDVKWDPQDHCINKNGDKIEGSPDGCEGHAGLEGLFDEDRIKRKSLRKRLARYATLHGELSLRNNNK